MASDILLDQTPWLNQTTACTYPAPWVERPDSELAQDDIKFVWNISTPLSAYEGVYRHPGFGNITIEIENGTYLVVYFGRFGKLRVQPITDTLFHGFYVDRLWFITNSDDNISQIEMEFVVSSEISELLFPVDFGQPKTSFLKGQHYKQIIEDRSSAYTSVTCDSGSARYIASSYLIVCMAILLLCSG